MYHFSVFVVAGIGALLLQIPGEAATPDGKGFPSADAAAQALVAAAKSDNIPELIEILGPWAKNIVATRGSIGDRKVCHDFAARATQRMKLVPHDGRRDAKTLLAGDDEWPLPILIVEVKGRWYFNPALQSKK